MYDVQFTIYFVPLHPNNILYERILQINGRIHQALSHKCGVDIRNEHTQRSAEYLFIHAPVANPPPTEKSPVLKNSKKSLRKIISVLLYS